MGDSGQTDKECSLYTLQSGTDHLDFGRALYAGNSKIAWSISEHCVRSRHKISIPLLAEFAD